MNPIQIRQIRRFIVRNQKQFIILSIVVLILVYVVYIQNSKGDSHHINPNAGGALIHNRQFHRFTRGDETSNNSISSSNLNRNVQSPLVVPARISFVEELFDPPPLEEIERNMTLYLSTLHKKLEAIAGPTVTGVQVWDVFSDVTKKMPMIWDEENKYRFPQPRSDNSIFVSLGTYRDPFCPMTIKSLFANAKHPERLFVGLFQQNCFGPKCRTGVLVGGKVEDAGPDPDCYVEFCKSQEGIASDACNNGHIRLFNVNESESLGPYMARYLGGIRSTTKLFQIDLMLLVKTNSDSFSVL